MNAVSCFHHTGVHYVPPDEASPTELPACGYGSPAESEDQQMEGDAQSQDSSSELKPRILDVISICKTEAEDRELGHQKDVSSADEQRLFSQFDSSSTDETCNRIAPTVATPRVKNEPEDTIITITSSVTTTPAHAGPRQDSEPAHQMRTASDASTLLRRPQKKEHLRPRFIMPRRAHAKDHEEPYKCNKCGRQLKDLAKLQLHNKLHERSFICHWCGRNFLKFDYLRMHMRTHTGERPYQCNWCSKTFSQSGNMRRHERTCRNFNEESTSHGLEDHQLLAKWPLCCQIAAGKLWERTCCCDRELKFDFLYWDIYCFIKYIRSFHVIENSEISPVSRKKHHENELLPFWRSCCVPYWIPWPTVLQDWCFNIINTPQRAVSSQWNVFRHCITIKMYIHYRKEWLSKLVLLIKKYFSGLHITIWYSQVFGDCGNYRGRVKSKAVH